MILSLLSEYPLALIEKDCSAPLAQGHPDNHHLPQFMKDRLAVVFNNLAGTPRVQNKTLIHSDAFLGALIFTSRLLTPLWNSRVVAARFPMCDKPLTPLSTGKPISYELTIPVETLRFAKSAIDRLLTVCSQ